MLDSSKKTFVNRRDTNIGIGNVKISSKIEAEKTKYTTSSNQKIEGVKSSINSIPKRALTTIQNKQKSYVERFNSKLPPKENLFKFSLQLRSESFATNAQNPMQRNELVYSRLYVSPKFTVLGLPFTSNLFYTTESNNTYKNNYFAFRLDVNSLRQSATEQLQKEIDELNKIDRLRQFEISAKSVESDKINQQMEALKKQVPDYDNWQQTLKQEAERRVNEKLEGEKKALEEKLKNASENEKEKLMQAYEHKKDSMLLSIKSSLNDSINAFKAKTGENVDTAKLNKLMDLEKQYKSLQKQKEKLELLRKADTTGMASKIAGIRNPKNIREQMKSGMPNQGLLKSVLAVDRLGIGLTGAMYTDFTLSNMSLKGVDIGVSKKKYFWDATIGKTSKQFIVPFSSSKIVYNRPTGALRFGLGSRSSDFVALTYFTAFDLNTIDSLSPNVNNSVLSIGGKFSLLKGMIVEGEWAQSQYKEQYHYKVISTNTSNNISANGTMSYQIKAVQQAGKNTRFEIQTRQVGAAFRTIGNPFLRRNFRELESKVEQLFFKQKIKFLASYKEMRDNLNELNVTTNRIKGYGLKLNTSFDKYPNLMLSYSPYIQGNNHPDSLYRTNNQFSITTATINYKKRYKIYNWVGLVNYTRSTMEIGEKGQVAYKNISTTHSIQVGQRHNMLLSFFRNITAPFVDSLNSNSVQISYNYLAKKGLSIGLQTDCLEYKNNSYKQGVGIVATSTILKNLSISGIVRYDKIDGLWNLENKDVYTGKMVLVWRW